MDITIFTFIDTYRLAQPSVSVKEAGEAFMIHYGVDESLHSLKSILTTYERVLREFYDAKKTQHKQQ